MRRLIRAFVAKLEAEAQRASASAEAAAVTRRASAEAAAIARRAAAEAAAIARRASAEAAAIARRPAADAAAANAEAARNDAETAKLKAEARERAALVLRHTEFNYAALGIVGIAITAAIVLAIDCAIHESDEYIKRNMRQRLLSFDPPSHAAAAPTLKLPVRQVPLVPNSKFSEWRICGVGTRPPLSHPHASTAACPGRLQLR